MPNHGGIPSFRARSAAPYAPMALNAAWASETCPATPVTITSPSAMMAVDATTPAWKIRYSEATRGHARRRAKRLSQNAGRAFTPSDLLHRKSSEEALGPED